MSKLIKMLSAFLSAAVAPAWAATWYVDAAAEAGGDGSAERPYATIQAAVQAAGANETIEVAAGVYETDATVVDGCATRVAIVDRAGLRIVGAGRGKTVIKGAYGATLNNCGDGAVRCVTVKNSPGTILTGVSLVGGAVTGTTPPSGSANSAGGFYADTTEAYLVDAEISDCWALTGSLMVNGTAVRTLLAGGRVLDATASGYTAGCLGSRLVHSVLTRCQCAVNAGLLTNGKAYNTTIVDNSAAWAINGSVAAEAHNVICANTSLGDDLKNNVTSSGCVLKTAARGIFQCFSPAMGDYRLLDESDAIGVGDAACLGALGLPAEIDPYKDFLGATVPSSGAINAGAVQVTVAPTCGGVVFKRDNTTTIPAITVNGVRFPSDTYAYAETPWEQYVVTMEMAGGYWFNRAARSSDSTTVYSDLQDRLVLMPNPKAGVLETYSLQHAQKVIWVDRDRGNDTTGTGETNAPFASLQKAVDAVTANNIRALVMVQPGTYDNETFEDSGYGVFRVSTKSRQIHFRAVEGPETTTIVGASDPSTVSELEYAGCGPKAVHGILLTSPGRGSSCVQGFTIKACRSDRAGSGKPTEWLNSAAVWANNGSVVTDCLITDNVSAGAVATGTVLQRVRVLGNTSGGMMFRSNQAAVSSFFSNNRVLDRGASAVGVLAGEIFHCTLFTDEKKSGRLNCGGTVFDSIYDGGNAIYSATKGCGNLYWGVASIGGTSEYVSADPQFVDEENGGVVFATSPAVNGGAAPTDGNAGANLHKYASSDLEGALFRYDPAGKTTIGAFQRTVQCYQISVERPAKGGYELAGQRDWGEQQLVEGESLIFRAADGSRPCTGVRLGGKDYLFGDYDEILIPFADIAAVGSGAAVVGIYTTDWYLDAAKTDDADTGFRPNHGKKTFAAILPLMTDGDTLHVLPGTYDDGEMVQNESRLVKSRAVIPVGVSIVSTDGPAVTEIVGDEGVRCAYMRTRTKLEGFTLRGGRTFSNDVSCNDEDKQGGAVLGDSSNARAPSYGIEVRNCIVTGCFACQGCAGTRCQFVNCLITGNESDASGSIVYQASAYGCRLTANTATYGFLYCANVMNTTVEASNRQADGKTRVVGYRNASFTPLDNASIWNSVFACNLNLSKEKVDIRNTIVPTGSAISLADGFEAVNLIEESPSNIVFDENGAPAIGVNPAVDWGDASLEIPYLDAAKDLLGGQRVMNGKMDAGAVEADWRAVYSSLFSPKGVAQVTAADPMVTNGESRVTILDGSLTVAWPKREQTVDNAFRARVVGTGTLTVAVNGETIATIVAADGDKLVAFKPSQDVDTLVLAYAPGVDDTLGALVGAAVSKDGFLLMIR